MTKKHPLTFGALVVSETLSGLGMPGGSTVSSMLQDYLDRRSRDAANILIEEISAAAHESAGFLPDEIDPFIEICHRFSKAVEDGTARSNLKLLAQVIAGQKRNKALDPDGFRKWASVLSDLTRTELILVGTVIRVSAIHSRDVWNEVRKEMKDARFEPLEIEALGAAITAQACCLLHLHGGLLTTNQLIYWQSCQLL
ncbi:MAG: hypothetical protein AAGC96_10840 [Pseudomonadota bacterium]